jgi:hypothetical protein
VASASLGWRAGVYAAFVVQVALAASLSRRRELDALSVGTLAFFGAMSAVALASPHTAIHRWIAALSAGALAVIALASLAVGQPFTLAIARRSTPAELWDHPEFIRLNRFITSVWTVAFWPRPPAARWRSRYAGTTPPRSSAQTRSHCWARAK